MWWWCLYIHIGLLGEVEFGDIPGGLIGAV